MFVLGVVAGSVVTAWLVNRGRGSVLLVAVFHGTYNLVSGSRGASGVLAAVESTAVVVLAVVLLAQELIATHGDRVGRRRRHAMAPAR